MDEDIARYRQELLGEVRADAHVGGDYERKRFIDRACQVLESAEELAEYQVCRAHAPWKKMQVQVDAFNFSEGDGILNLLVFDYSGADDPQPLLTEEVRRLFTAAFRFLEGAVYDNVADCWDEGSEAHALANEVFEFANNGMVKARIYLVSDRPKGSQLGKLPEFQLGQQPVELQLWDIERLARVEMSSSGREEIRIDFAQDYGRGIAALPAGLSESSTYKSYLCVMPGEVLAQLYDRFGGRILEQNVRAFLGEGRKVNRGIRDTLRDNPSMFFAFNNGLTVTVSDLELDTGLGRGSAIVSATDFQVVNGGQTTASLYWAWKSGMDLSDVFVQMKLSRLPPDGFEDAVHDIARFANAQNAVSASDLFAGHPYFKRLEGLSRQTLAPATSATNVVTYWFFERTQGSYNVELKRKKGAAAKAWGVLHPKRQKLTKTDVARYEVTWAGFPHSVCSGAQKNVATFAKLITNAWSEGPEQFGTEYFRDVVVKAILTRRLDADIPAQEWYPGSILRQLCTYTLSLMGELMEEARLRLNYEAIWKAQTAPPEFVAEALRIAKTILPLLQEIPAEQTRNRLVTEWAKREACWLRIRHAGIELSEEFKATLKPMSGNRSKAERWDRRAAALWHEGAWDRLHDWNKSADVLTPDERDLVERVTALNSFGVRGFRLVKLKEAWERAVDAGFL
jgi:hypothetical protein